MAASLSAPVSLAAGSVAFALIARGLTALFVTSTLLGTSEKDPPKPLPWAFLEETQGVSSSLVVVSWRSSNAAAPALPVSSGKVASGALVVTVSTLSGASFSFFFAMSAPAGLLRGGGDAVASET